MHLWKRPVYSHAFGEVRVDLEGIASRTGTRAKALKERHPHEFSGVKVVVEPDSVKKLIELGVDVVCIATPDDRHYSAALEAINAGKHVLIEKPSVLTVQEWKTLVEAAEKKGVLAKVVYHKLLDPDHKKLRTLVADGVLKHVNNGYCSLLEPKSISKGQFAEWIDGRNPATYVAVHYIKLIDFTFGGKLRRVSATGQRGIVGSKIGDTWDSVQLRLEYEYDDGREAAFDIHTSWVTPDNFPGYVEQEVQFRFDNGVWNGHSRKRGVELTVEGETPIEPQDDAQQPLQRRVSGTVGRTHPARLRHRSPDAVLRGSQRCRVQRSCRTSEATVSRRFAGLLTTTCQQTNKSWPPCRRSKRS